MTGGWGFPSEKDKRWSLRAVRAVEHHLDQAREHSEAEAFLFEIALDMTPCDCETTVAEAKRIMKCQIDLLESEIKQIKEEYDATKAKHHRG